MPIDWRLDLDSRIATMTYVHPFTFAEWQTAVDSILADPRFGPEIAFLTDRRAVGAPDKAFVDNTVSYVEGRARVFLGRRIALVVRPGAPYGMARMQEMLSERLGAVLRVFTDLDEARAWLDEPPST